MANEPICISCDTVLRVGANWTEAQKRNKNYKCNMCRAFYQMEYHKANRDSRLASQKERYYKNKKNVLAKQKEYYLENKYGISLDTYNYYMSQPCKICNKTTDLVLDHCHTTGLIRNTLCRQCNAALGLFKDSEELLEKARRYLVEHKTSD